METLSSVRWAGPLGGLGMRLRRRRRNEITADPWHRSCHGECGFRSISSPRASPFTNLAYGRKAENCEVELLAARAPGRGLPFRHHLGRILRSYCNYCLNLRPHLSSDRNAPTKREVEPQSCGRMIAIPQVGGLHHRDRRVAWANVP